MSLNKIIGRKSDYYIATYSAHASILQNLIGENGKELTLLVDGGGLKAHAGTFTNTGLFKNYTPVTRKTLHAKVIYLSGPKLLCLMTGNLRATAMSVEENVVIIQSLSSRQGSAIVSWFRKKEMSDHLFIQIAGNTASNVYANKKTIWEEFKTRVEGIKEETLSVFAFSPWGSSRFVHEIGKLMKDRLSKLALYTRDASPDDVEKKTSMWIDSNIKGKSPAIERYTRKENFSFPHFKAIFITKKGKSDQEELVFAYIGSANLTEAAFFKKDNIEHAVFFTDIARSSNVNSIFKKMKNRKNWEERIDIRIVGQSIEEQDNDGIETWETDNFEVRRVSKKIIKILQSAGMQKKLENNFVSKGRSKLKLQNPKCDIVVKSIENSMFELIVDYRGTTFQLSIPRDSKEEILSDSDIEASIQQLLDTSAYSSNVKAKTKKEISKEKDSSMTSRKFKNIRFPIEKFILNKSLVEKKKQIVGKLDKATDRINEEDRAIYEMWSQIIRHL